MDITPPTAGPFSRALSTSGTAVMVVGTFLAAVAAYAFQLVAGRVLGPVEFAPITVLWTVQFLVFTTVFLPIEQLTIRRLAATQPEPPPRILFGSAVVLAVAASVGFATLTLDRLLDGRPVYLVVVAAIITAYGAFALARGTLAGRRRFAEYGWATLAESVSRLAVAALLLAIGAGVVGVAWSLVVGPLFVYAWHPFRTETRAPRTTPAPEERTALLTFVVANAAAQTIVAAGPIVVGALGAGNAERSVFFETFLLFRAPLTVAYSLIARVLPPFTRVAETDRRPRLGTWAMRVGMGAAVLSGVGYAAGDLVGPDLVALFLGDEYRPGGTLAGLAVAGVVLATAALFAQQILIALHATTRLAASWLCGLAAAAVAVALAPGSASLRVGGGFLVGEAVSLGLIVFTAVRASRTQTTDDRRQMTDPDGSPTATGNR